MCAYWLQLALLNIQLSKCVLVIILLDITSPIFSPWKDYFGYMAKVTDLVFEKKGICTFALCAYRCHATWGIMLSTSGAMRLLQIQNI